MLEVFTPALTELYVSCNGKFMCIEHTAFYVQTFHKLLCSPLHVRKYNYTYLFRNTTWYTVHVNNNSSRKMRDWSELKPAKGWPTLYTVYAKGVLWLLTESTISCEDATGSAFQGMMPLELLKGEFSNVINTSIHSIYMWRFCFSSQRVDPLLLPLAPLFAGFTVSCFLKIYNFISPLRECYTVLKRSNLSTTTVGVWKKDYFPHVLFILVESVYLFMIGLHVYDISIQFSHNSPLKSHSNRLILTFQLVFIFWVSFSRLRWLVIDSWWQVWGAGRNHLAKQTTDQEGRTFEAAAADKHAQPRLASRTGQQNHDLAVNSRHKVRFILNGIPCPSSDTVTNC